MANPFVNTVAGAAARGNPSGRVALNGWTANSITPQAQTVAAQPNSLALADPTLGSRVGAGIQGVTQQNPQMQSGTNSMGIPASANGQINDALYAQMLANIFGGGIPNGLMGGTNSSGLLGGTGNPFAGSATRGADGSLTSNRLYTGPTPLVGYGGGGTGRSVDYSNSPTPEQAYARALESRGAATTAPMNILGQILWDSAHSSAYNDQPMGYGGLLTSGQLSAQQRLREQQNALNWNSGVSRAAAAAGGSTIYAPAPTPQWGYPSTYGQSNNGSGWASSNTGSSWGGVGGSLF